MTNPGIVFIMSGFVMCFFKSFSFTKEKKIIDIGPREVNKKENKTIGWPIYAGIGVGLFGIALIAVDKKEK